MSVTNDVARIAWPWRRYPRTDTSHQSAKNGRGMWPQCGVGGPSHTFRPRPISQAPPGMSESLPYLQLSLAVAAPDSFSEFVPAYVLTGRGREDYIHRYGAPSAFGAMTRLRSTSMKLGDQASGLDRKCETSTALRLAGGGSLQGPGLFDK
jgi:hypothetical protein